MKLRGSKALVTGGSRGIGAEIARVLAREGADVAVNYRKSKDAAKQVVADIEKIGRKAVAIQCDVSDSKSVDTMTETAIEELGGLDILIVNAGVASRGNPIRKTEDREWNYVMGVDLNGAFYAARAGVRHMHTEKSGSIVFISSVAGTVHAPWHIP